MARIGGNGSEQDSCAGLLAVMASIGSCRLEIMGRHCGRSEAKFGGFGSGRRAEVDMNKTSDRP